jgi:hypothetical protein
MDSRYSALEEGGGGGGSRSSLPHGGDNILNSSRRQLSGIMRRRGINSCRRCVIFLVVAVGVVILPLGMLYTFEGIENGKGELAVEKPSVNVISEIHASTTSAVIASQSSTSASSISLPAPTTTSGWSQTWSELPRRNLTRYVDPLIGTEGHGHCTLTRNRA